MSSYALSEQRIAQYKSAHHNNTQIQIEDLQSAISLADVELFKSLYDHFIDTDHHLVSIFEHIQFRSSQLVSQLQIIDLLLDMPHYKITHCFNIQPLLLLLESGFSFPQYKDNIVQYPHLLNFIIKQYISPSKLPLLSGFKTEHSKKRPIEDSANSVSKKKSKPLDTDLDTELDNEPGEHSPIQSVEEHKSVAKVLAGSFAEIKNNEEHPISQRLLQDLLLEIRQNQQKLIDLEGKLQANTQTMEHHFAHSTNYLVTEINRQISDIETSINTTLVVQPKNIEQIIQQTIQQSLQQHQEQIHKQISIEFADIKTLLNSLKESFEHKKNHNNNNNNNSSIPQLHQIQSNNQLQQNNNQNILPANWLEKVNEMVKAQWSAMIPLLSREIVVEMEVNCLTKIQNDVMLNLQQEFIAQFSKELSSRIGISGIQFS